MAFSTDETADLGEDRGSAVSDDYTPEDSEFTGTVNWVRLDIGDDSHDHQSATRTARRGTQLEDHRHRTFPQLRGVLIP